MQTVLTNPSLFDTLPMHFEGDSRTLKQMEEEDLLLCRLKPTVFSLADQGTVYAEGIDAVRTELNALFCKELELRGVRTSTLRTEDGLILMRKEKVPPIEVIVKGALLGSPKHIYAGICETPTRHGDTLGAGAHHVPYVRFDWRNPLPKEDACMPEALADYFIDVEQAKQTALAAYEILRCYCLRHQLDLLDICFFMNEDGDTICAEVSTDNVRLKYLGEDPEIAGLLNSRDKERATERAEAVLQLLRTPFLKHSRFVVSGGFCAGKTSLIRLLQDTMGIPKLIDHSTRDMRPGEREGFPYHFLTRQEFEAALDKGAYYEWVEFNGNYYGVPREIVFEGEAWALDILSASAKDYKGKVPGVFSIFIESPAEEVIIARARARGDSEEKIRERLVYARAESSEGFDLVLPANSTLEQKLALVSQAINE